MIKKIALLLTICMMFSFTACSLAKPEEKQSADTADRLIGVYILDDVQANAIHEMEGWVEDGTEQHEMDSVNIALPRLIYKAEFVEGEHRYQFPGLKGYALFAATVGQGQEAYTTTCSDLENVNVKFHTRDADLSIVQTGIEDAEMAGSVTDYELTGTIYVENADSENHYLRLMNVFQKPDGTIYLDGTGDAFASAGSVSLEEKSSRTVNGEKVELGTTKVTVTIEEAKEADSGILYWYGETGELLMTQPLDPEQVTELTWQEKAAWVIYEETFGEEVVHTLYEKGTEEEPVCLSIMTIDEDGIGKIKTVEIK